MSGPAYMQDAGCSIFWLFNGFLACITFFFFPLETIFMAPIEKTPKPAEILQFSMGSAPYLWYFRSL